MANPTKTNDTSSQLAGTGSRFGSVMNTFSGLPGPTGEGQEILVVRAIEIAGLGRYEAWDLVEPPKVFDTIKDTWHTLIHKTKKSKLTDKEAGVQEKEDVTDEDWLVLGTE